MKPVNEMQEMKLISEFQENDTINTPLMIYQVTKGIANNRSPYLNVLFQDKTGQIEAKLWDVKPEQIEVYQPGAIGMVRGEVLEYRNAFQLKILEFKPVDPKRIKDMSRFIQSSQIDLSDLKRVVFEAIASISYMPLRNLVDSMIRENEDKFFTYPAASKNHHEFMNGLAEHVYGMLRLGDAICNLYPSLNRDLIVAGILMHDLGKTIELSGAILTEYTMEGKLLGHISIMQAMIAQEASKLGIEGDESIVLLRHMVLSHHGEYEYGSPVLPLIPEAEILTYIDNIDARMNMMNKALANIEPGSFAQRVFSLENRTFYKSKFDKE